MTKQYTYTAAQLTELEEAYRAATGQNQRKIQIVMLRAEGVKIKEVIKVTKTNTTTITRWTKVYASEGIEGLLKSRYHGHNQYISFEEESAFLDRFKVLAEKGQITTPQ